MLKVSWVTENFIDVDFPVINELSKFFNIDWHISHRLTSQFYKVPDILNLQLAPNVERHLYITKARYRSPKSIAHYMKIIMAIKKENPDIIYLNIMGLPYFFPLVRVFLPNKKIIYAGHDVIEHVGEKKGWYMTYYRNTIFKQFNNFHLFSQHQADYFAERFPRKKYFVARLFTKDYGTGNVQRKEFDNMPIRLLFFGRMRPDKGLMTFIKAANRIHKDYPGAIKVTIAGHCENWEPYQNAIEDPSLFTLIIRLIQNNEIPDLFNQAHYAVMPYLDVTQSGVLMVCYQYGVPVIVSDFGEFRNDVTDGETGYLINPPSDPDSLYAIIEKLILEKNKNYNSMRTNLLSFINNNISISKIAASYAAFFNDPNFN